MSHRRSDVAWHSAEENEFRAETRAWLTERAAPRPEQASTILPLFEHDRSGEDERAWVKACREWQQAKYEGGYAGITWPQQWGGRDGSLIEEIIFAEEEARFEVETGAFVITLGMVAPTILAHGTDEQRAHLSHILCGDEVWCQLYSEPSAGSDLAALRTRAVQDGNEWLVTGQKVWTSGAQYADWGYLLARSDPGVAKHAGLTAFILPMDTPGVTISPLRQITGGSGFNEVFLDEVRIPDRNRLGAPGSGWRVALTTLMNERFSVGGIITGRKNFGALIHLARAAGRASDPRIRQRLAELYIELEALRFTNQRALTAISKGQVPGPEGSVIKLLQVRILQAMGNLAVEIAAVRGTLDGPECQFLLGVPGMRVGGGTDEVLRNVLGERVLGLPGEPRSDTDVPFTLLPT